ncbi:hypothetical protein J2X16_004874 [Pelomonas aquatica]|uniref:Uncharacterized protein n=1 Tax=Pelomonas aquatica TaxID=431058 RepID=A0ABU1ZFU1_9BURK|nr:hypothetical protein [Pelomonas aquatica]MDR7299504.1 hypothetical protein [Pelomonas aquatica]
MDHPADFSAAQTHDSGSGAHPLRTASLCLPAQVEQAVAASLTAALEKALRLMIDSGQQRTVLRRADHLAMLATGLLEPHLEPVEDRIHRMKAVQEVFAQGDWLTAVQINARQANPPDHKAQPASDWKRRGRVFSVNYGGREYFARYQFDALCQPLPLIKDLLKAIGEVADTWVVASWFNFPNGWLDGAAPRHSLDQDAAVMAAAERRQGTYEA